MVIGGASGLAQQASVTVSWAVAALLAGAVLSGLAAYLVLRVHAARRRSELRFHALVHNASDVIIVLNYDGLPTYVSPSAKTIMGYPPESLLGRFYGNLIFPEDLDRMRSMRQAVRATPARDHRIEVRFLHADGSWHWHEVIARNLLHDPAVRGIVVNHHDVTERRKFQDRLAHDASHDALTGLSNRAAFMRDLGRALVTGDRQDHLCAALSIDINGFKQINDLWGHTTGDALLAALGRVLRRCVLGADTVARLGGDGFGICLTRIAAPDQAQAVARRIIAGLGEPLNVSGHAILVHASIGIAVSRPGVTDADELLRRADRAMYEVKRQLVGGWRLYTEEMEQRVTKAAVTAGDLQRAIGHGELALVYQPIVHLNGGEMAGVEALVRWRHPVLGPLSPYEFISLAEASGLIGPLGEWVLEQACAQVRGWQEQLGRRNRLVLSVNLSPRQLDDPGLTGRVRAILERTGFAARDLLLEITEDALVNDDCAVPVLEALHELGIRIALDDFGTGYSSLRYLTRLPVDVLKLDRCFVGDLDGTPEGSAVAEAVIKLSQALGLETIAEGIENQAQATELILLGYPLAQGFRYARPMDAETIEALLVGGEPPVLPLEGRWPVLPARRRGPVGSAHGSDHLSGDDRAG